MSGFLPFSSRSFFMMDFVCVAMVLFLPAMFIGVFLAKYKKSYQAHKVWQISLTSILLVTVILFEIEVRLSNWKESAGQSPYYETLVFPVLYVHLCFAVSTLLLWLYSVWGALRGFKGLIAPGKYSITHSRLGFLSIIGMSMTAVSGWMFYYLAFVA